MKHVKLFEQFLNEGVKFGPKAIKDKLKEKIEIAKRAIEKWGDSYEPSLKKVEDAFKSGKIDAENIIMTQGDEPKDNYDIFMGNNAKQLAAEISKVIKKYKKHEVEQTSVASAPDTSRFRATVSGDIKGHANFSSGYENWLIAVTVGGGVDRNIRKQIFQEVYELMFIFDQYNGSDGGVSISSSSGTNYHTFGLKNSKYSFNRGVAANLETIMNS